MPSQIRICAVVVGNTLEEFLQNLELVQAKANLVELRVDYISDLKVENLEIIKSRTTSEAILTCRSKNHGGNFNGNLSSQNEILQKANDLGFEYIDIDLPIYDQIKIENKKSQIIISYHNFDHTPTVGEFMNLYTEMRTTDADIYKFATMVQDEKDLNTIYRVIVNKGSDEKVIAIGMGELGRITRIVGPLLGSYLTFASVNQSKSAPGQVDIEELKEIYSKYV